MVFYALICSVIPWCDLEVRRYVDFRELFVLIKHSDSGQGGIIGADGLKTIEALLLIYFRFVFAYFSHPV